MTGRLDKLDPLTNFELVQEFHTAFNFPVDNWSHTVANKVVDLRLRLIEEELKELKEEFFTLGPAHKLAKEIADLLYVVYGAAADWGIPIDAVFREVHKSNMSKLGRDGLPVLRGDGKILKGPDYKEPNIKAVLEQHGYDKC